MAAFLEPQSSQANQQRDSPPSACEQGGLAIDSSTGHEYLGSGKK